MIPEPPEDASAGDPAAGDDATVISSRPEESSGAGGSTVPRPAAGRAGTAEIGRVLEGSMLGPYRLDRFIGGGGMGAVFQALDTTLHRIVAIKVLARQQSDDEENLRRFRNEAQSAARLDHENIGRVYAVGSDEGWHYIVLEYIEGTNLRDLIRNEGPFDPVRMVDVSIQVAEALEHASEREVVHRDIKPSNIVITPAGRARIVDMGLARLHQVAGDAELTVSGMTLGTFDYISPEQARDPRAADVRSDLYSLGCTMFFMLAGRPPFAEGTMVQKLLQHQQAEPRAIDELRPDVPRRLSAIIARLMEKDPLDRYQRPAGLVADLVACAEAEGYPLSAQRAPATPAARPERGSSRLPWLIPLLLLAAVVGGLWLRSAGIRREAVERQPAQSIRGGTGPVAQPPVLPAAGSPAVEPATGEPEIEEPANVRVVSTAAALATAIAESHDGEILEIDAAGDLDLGPFSVAGRRLSIRSAAGRQPVLRIPPQAEGMAVDVGDGSLTLRGLTIQIPEGSRPAVGRRSLFTIAGGRLVCEAVVLRMPAARRPAGTVTDPAAFVQVVDAAADTLPPDTVIDLTGVRAAGDATLVDVQASRGARVSVRWDSGAALTRRLVAAEGSRSGDVLISATLADLIVACSDSLVTLRDSPAWPRIPTVEVQATGCRFVVADPARSFIEQTGISEPEAYLAALLWKDRHGRYEGSRVFQRIDGAAERVELPFGQPTVPLVHDPRVADLPNPADWGVWAE
jgi:serine/threonine protein kinase